MTLLLPVTSTADQPNDHLYAPDQPYTASELSALAYHGALRPQFGPYYVDATRPDTASQRAKSVKRVADRCIDGPWTATLRTAAWIHLGGHSPEVLEATTPAAHRPTARSRLLPRLLRQPSPMDGLEVHYEDFLMMGGAVVTSPARTIIDLLSIEATARHQRKVIELLRVVQPDKVRRRLAEHTGTEDVTTTGEIFERLVATGQPVVANEA